jgi:hypothetical protein
MIILPRLFGPFRPPSPRTGFFLCDFFIFRYSLRPESSQKHLPTSIAGVLRLRATKRFVTR